MNDRRKQEHHGYGRYKISWLVGILVSAAFFSLFFGAGHGLGEIIYRMTGRPSGVWTTIIPALLGLCILAVTVKLFMVIHSHIKHGDGRHDKHNYHNSLMDKTIDALNRIAQGDFSVLLPVDKNDPFAAITETVNKMAQELGSMEQLRQDFISNVSHEIQSPLTSISGFAMLLKNEGIKQEQRAHYLDVIETEAKRLSKLSDNLLKLSSLENSMQPLTLAEFRLDKQIQNAALILEPQWAEKNISLSLELEKVCCTGDENLLIQVWLNLLHNAIKFTPEQGKITVTLAAGEEESVCRISDTGIGISKEDQRRIFERFYKADKARDRHLGGNGLGLSLVKKIIRLHDGNVLLESTLQAGSIFSVTLPNKKE